MKCNLNFVWFQIIFDNLKFHHILLLYANFHTQFIYLFHFLCVEVLRLDSFFSFASESSLIDLNLIYHSKYFHVIFCMYNGNDRCKCQRNDTHDNPKIPWPLVSTKSSAGITKVLQTPHKYQGWFLGLITMIL